MELISIYFHSIVPLPIRRCVTAFFEETETDTSESFSDLSQPSRSKGTFELIEVVSDRPISPALSQISESTLVPEDPFSPPDSPLPHTLSFSTTNEAAKPEPVIPVAAVPSRSLPYRRRTMTKGSTVFCSLNNEGFKSPFYIYTPALRYRTRSSSLPLFYRPSLVRSKLRRAVTDSPATLDNIIEEYDADLDDSDLPREEEEWNDRIYASIIRSITSPQTEDLLKQIEQRVEGTSDRAVRIRKGGRRKKTHSTAREGGARDSDSDTQNPANLSVKPRRKRRKSKDLRLDGSDTTIDPPVISTSLSIADPVKSVVYCMIRLLVKMVYYNLMHEAEGRVL
eukprot:sb/3466496/